MPDHEIDEETPAHVTVVYNPRDGEVVHVHEFYGKSFDPNECARAALKIVASLGLPTHGLEVLHPSGFRMRPDITLKVDLKSRQVVATPTPSLQAHAIERLRRKKER